jgi:hypothetical protein
MFCFYFVLSFDACIVTITWSLLFVVIALWVICLTQKITLAPHSLSALPTLVCFIVFHRLTGKHLALLVGTVSSLNPSMKLHALHGSVVPLGVTVLLGLCNPPCRGHGEPAKHGLMYPLVWIPCCDIVGEIPGLRSRVGSIASDLESWVTCCDRED